MPACCVSAQSFDILALNQFRKMILCVMPDSSPVFDYADYGCYCGMGGSGTPVDDLDRSLLNQPLLPTHGIQRMPQTALYSLSQNILHFDIGAAKCNQCYSDAMQHSACWPILDNPYTEFYDYSCDESSRTVTCGSKYSLNRLVTSCFVNSPPSRFEYHSSVFLLSGLW